MTEISYFPLIMLSTYAYIIVDLIATGHSVPSSLQLLIVTRFSRVVVVIL